MTREKFARLYLTPSTASTTATKRATQEDLRAARADRGVDYHVEQATAKE